MQFSALLVAATITSPPSGFHVAWADGGGLWVTWTDLGSTGDPKKGNPRCKYDGVGEVAAVSGTYTDVCDAPQCTRWVGWVRTAKIPDSGRGSVRYSCGDDVNGFGDEVTAATQVFQNEETFSFLATADVGAYQASHYVQSAMCKFVDAKFFLMPGDISYAGGNQSIWDDFATLWEPISSKIPTLLSPGNHDGEFLYGNNYHLPASSWVGGGESGTAYSLRYPGPGKPIAYNSPDPDIPTMTSTAFWWSASYGPVRVIALSGVHDMSVGSEQNTWFDTELQSVKEKWVVVTNHFPMYCTIDDCFCGNFTKAAMEQRCEPGQNGSTIPGILKMNSVFLKASVEPIMIKHNKVDVFLSGHEHAYERTLPVLDFAVPPTAAGKTGFPVTFTTPNAPVHLMAGTGGGGPDTKWRSTNSFPWASTRSDLAVDDTFPFGFVEFEVSQNATKLQVKYYNVDAKGGTVVRDQFAIVKP